LGTILEHNRGRHCADSNAETGQAIQELENPDKRRKLKKHAGADAMLADILGKRRNQAKRRA
jgi:hypothetical protein